MTDRLPALLDELDTLVSRLRAPNYLDGDYGSGHASASEQAADDVAELVAKYREAGAEAPALHRSPLEPQPPQTDAERITEAAEAHGWSLAESEHTSTSTEYRLFTQTVHGYEHAVAVEFRQQDGSVSRAGWNNVRVDGGVDGVLAVIRLQGLRTTGSSRASI